MAKMLKMIVADEDNDYCQSDDGIFEKYVKRMPNVLRLPTLLTMSKRWRIG